jgi:hypothetical protein
MFSSGYRHVHQEDCKSSLFTAAKTLLISHSSMSAKVPHGTASLAATLEASSHMVLQPFTPFYFHKQPTADKTPSQRPNTSSTSTSDTAPSSSSRHSDRSPRLSLPYLQSPPRIPWFYMANLTGVGLGSLSV